MTTQTETKPWDFSHVLDLVNSLSSRDLSVSEQAHKNSYGTHGHAASSFATSAADIATHDFGTPASKLGDFGKIWQFLGTPLESPAPQLPALEHNLPNKIDYTSDGATYFKTPVKSGKEVTWTDQAGNDEPGTDTLTDGSVPETPCLTKTQRKKQRRKERKAKEAAVALKNATVSESEADSVRRRTPARKASAHFVKFTPAQSSTPIKAREEPNPSRTNVLAFSDDEVHTATKHVEEMLAARRKSNTTSLRPSKGTPSRPGQLKSSQRQQSNPGPAAAQHSLSKQNDQSNVSTKQWPVNAKKASTLQLFPSSVQPPKKSAVAFPQHQLQITKNQNTPPTTVVSKPRFVIEPKVVRSGEDRHWALLMKLIADFWQDRKHLIAPMNLTTHNNDPNGIHVFVDASNIFIGFNDQLKRSRHIPLSVHLPSAHLSFDGLALLMERRRPVAKRVLAGSTPHLPAFDQAQAVGYECSILDKVYKARELTERQIYFKDHNRFGRPLPHATAKAPAGSDPPLTGESLRTPGTYHGTGSGSGGSGSETGNNAPQYAPAKMIEQGVDEILHLKMMESVVDSEVPSTMVLATGDAAQAEYSPGFMVMLERALKKGWKVEVVSWSRNISGMYRKKDFTETWGDRFRVVYLDDYAEELLEM